MFHLFGKSSIKYEDKTKDLSTEDLLIEDLKIFLEALKETNTDGILGCKVYTGKCSPLIKKEGLQRILTFLNEIKSEVLQTKIRGDFDDGEESGEEDCDSALRYNNHVHVLFSASREKVVAELNHYIPDLSYLTIHSAQYN